MKTAIKQMIEEFEEIQKTKCKTLQEVVFFDGVLALIQVKYLPTEKQQIIDAAEDGRTFDDGEHYYNSTFKDK